MVVCLSPIITFFFQSHRGSSPQIRTYAPDGRSTTLPHPPEHPLLHVSLSSFLIGMYCDTAVQLNALYIKIHNFIYVNIL